MMTTITDEMMRERIGKTKDHALVILKSGVYVYGLHDCRGFPGDRLG